MNRHLTSFCFSFLALFLMAVPLTAQKKETALDWVKRGNEAKEDHLKIIYYSEAIRIAPAEAQPYLWRGMAKRKVGKYSEAIADFDSALVRRPNYESALTLRGDAYLTLKRFDKAELDFKTALSVNPDSDFSLARLGELSKNNGNLKQAKAYWTQAFRKNPRNEYASERLALAYAAESKPDSAIFYATETIQSNSLNVKAWTTRGTAHLQKGDLVKAAADLEMAVAKSPLDITAQIALSDLRKQQSRPNEAIKILYTVLENEPNNTEAKQKLAQAEKLTTYRPLRPKPKPEQYKLGIEVVSKAPPPDEKRLHTPPLTGGSKLPQMADLSADMPMVRSQGGQNSCGPHAASYVASYYEKKETGKSRVFSPAYLYYHSNRGQDKGVLLAELLDNWMNKGICLESSMPYRDDVHTIPPSQSAATEGKKYKIQAYFGLWTLEEVKYQVSVGHPIIISVLADQSLKDVKSAPWAKRYGKEEGAHAMVVVGYDDERAAVKVINSWGRTWGEGGYGWIAYSLFEEVRLQLFLVKDALNIEQQDYADIVIPQPKPEPSPYITPSPVPIFTYGTPSVYIQVGNRNFLTGTLDITGFANVPPLSGYFAQIVVYYYDAFGNKLSSQQYPFTTFDGQASHSTNVTNIPFLGLPNQNWWVRTPSTVFPFWQRQGWAIVAQPVLFIDGFQAAVGPLVTL